MFPEKFGEEKETEESVDIPTVISGYQNSISIKSPKSGYLQYIDIAALTEIEIRNDGLLELYYRPGGHLVEGMEIGLLHLNGNWYKNELEKIFDQFVIGKTKTSQQDLELSIHQDGRNSCTCPLPGSK